MNDISYTGRQIYIDVAKGIGIIMVVWAHAMGPFSDYIYSFHMPYFFFISGMLYTGKKSVAQFTKRKVNSLLLPFWIYNLMLYPVFFVLYYWKRWSFKVCLKELFEIITTVSKVPFLGATWFLAGLFWVSIIIHAVYIGFQKYGISDLILLPLGMIATAVGFQITFPYRISRTLICSGFYVMGFIYCKYIRMHISIPVGGIIAVMMFMVSVFLYRQYPGTLAENTYDNKVTFMIGALFATLFFLFVSRVISLSEKSSVVKMLAYLGKDSIYIVIWQFLAFRFAIILQIIFVGAKVSALTAFPTYDTSGIWFTVYLLSGIIGALIIGKIMDKLILERVRKNSLFAGS